MSLPQRLRPRSKVQELALCALAASLACACGRDADAPTGPVAAPSAGPSHEDDEQHELAESAQRAPAPAPEPAPSAAPGPRAAREKSAPAPGAHEVAERLEAWAKQRKGHAHLAMFDLETRTWVVEFGADEMSNPASTQKILTAAAALDLLGPAYTFRTEVLGKLEGGVIAKLVLRGGGAPDLGTSDLWKIARSLHEGGLRTVQTLAVDQSRFDDAYVPPAFEQQPHEWAAFRAPVSALALDHNAITLHVAPTSEGQPAISWFDPPGAMRSKGTVGTSSKGSGDHVTWSLVPETGATSLVGELGGQLAVDSAPGRYSKRLDDPRRVGGQALAEILLQLGVQVPREVGLEAIPGLARLTFVESAPLGVLVRALGKDSDNFSAEMLTIALSQLEDKAQGPRSTKPWSTARGLTVMRRWLEEHGLSSEGLVLMNGSGLFDANRVSPRVLTRVLDYMFERPASSIEFAGQLAQAGQDGTLRGRFLQGPLAGRVRAKTGTLKDTSALAGYVLRADGRRPLAFAILLSGAAGRQGEARAHIDDTLEAIVAKLGP